jgi:signal transduction histidine kinase/CheY-like chemotaxis protein
MNIGSVVSLQSIRDLLLPGLLLYASYVLTGSLGLSISPVHDFAALVWPPAGIAVAALLLWSNRLWPVVFLAAFTVNFLNDAPVLVAAGIAAGNTLEALTASYLMHRIGFERWFGRLRDSLGFIILAAIWATTISATTGTGSLALGGLIPASDILLTWLVWWVGDIMGVLIIAPLILTWLSGRAFNWTAVEMAERVAILTSIAVITLLVSWVPFIQASPVSLFFVLIIPLIWAGLRAGPRIVTLGIFLTAAIVLTGLLQTSDGVSLQDLLLTQLFIGTITIVFLIFTSAVEERKNAINALRKHVVNLEDALKEISYQDEAKNEFLALLAHELRNPLAPIVSSVELIKLEKGLDTPVRRVIRTIDEHINTLVRLVDDLLDTSRISQKKLKLQREPVELQRVMRRCMAVVEPLMKSRGHTFTASIPPEPLWLEADPVRLEQIVVNILNNAAKYTENGGKVDLQVRVIDGAVEIRVRDTGIGIPANMLDKIFEPFLQVERRDRLNAGIGIGLALTKYLTEMHGGMIEAYSSGEGQGSEFVVVLPLLPSAPPPQPRQTESTGRKAMSSPLRVLVVDDNEAAAKTLGKLLTMRGHTVEMVFTGRDAMDAERAFKPDVVLLDVGLPDIDGYEVARRLRAQHTTATLVAVTGYGAEKDKEQALEAGFSHHLVKPVGLAELESIFKNLHPVRNKPRK